MLGGVTRVESYEQLESAFRPDGSTTGAGRVGPTRRRTRVVATIGPASDNPTILEGMVKAGMDMARLPLAHGSIDDAVARYRRIRQAAPNVGILADLPGPKVRCTPFPEGGVTLSSGSEVLLTPASDTPESSASRIGVSLDELVATLEEGDRVALGDGGVALVALGREGDAVRCRVAAGGKVQGRPGVTAPASRLSLQTPTEEDLSRLAVLLEEGIDGVAVSFVRTADDLITVRNVAGAGTLLCAKLETPESMLDLDRILEVSDAVMVARGDLGVRVPLEDVPHIQKQIIRAAVAYGRPVITATQMLESMIYSPVPTRAEVADVANAVFDGTSAVMTSGETAVGVDPVGVVATMARIAQRAEREFDYDSWGASLGSQQLAPENSANARITAAITAAAWRASIEEKAAAIVACTGSGATARAISRFRPEAPIVAATHTAKVARQLTVSWGVDTILIPESHSTDELVWYAVQAVVQAGYARAGDLVVVLAGRPTEPEPVTDTVRLVRIR
jgi:pyruvate kinase